MRELLSAIVAEPDDEVSRLVLADVLTEQGDPRGELISLQIAQARGPLPNAALSRIDALIDVCWDELVAPIRAAGVQRFFIRRGFVEGVTLPVKRMAALPDLVASVPLRSVTFTGVGDAAPLSGMRELDKLRVLDLRGLGLGNRRVTELLRSRHLHRLTTLVLSGNGLGAAAAKALSRAALGLPSLESLYLQANHLGARGVESLVSSRLVSQLERLGVDADDVSDEHRAALAARRCQLVTDVDAPERCEAGGVSYPRAAGT